MLLRLLRAAFAVLVAVAFGCLPALTLASPATASPPLEFVVLGHDVVQDEGTNILLCAHPASFADAGPIASLENEAPAYPLRE